MKNTHFCLAAMFLAAAGAFSTAVTGAEVVKLPFLSSGAMPKLGGYMPQRLELSAEKPSALKQAPADLGAPLYGQLKLGPSDAPNVFLVVVDELDGKPARLWVDANANGDLTDDPPAEWKVREVKAPNGDTLRSYNGGATLKVAFGSDSKELHLGMYRFDKNDPQRAALKNTLLYYADYAYIGDLKLGGKTYAAILADQQTTGDFRGKDDPKSSGISLMIDVNADGKFDNRRERFDVRKPFNLGGTTYEIRGLQPSGSTFEIAQSSQTVPEIPAAPNLAVGQKAIGFERKTTDGKTVKFPTDYQGKLVMLDFWATWCGPCRAEIPNLVATHEKFHSRGFEVLGISLDQPNAADKLAKYTQEQKMTWPQVYDGKYWQAEIGQMYDVDSIPRCFLIDGDSGQIVATTENLRGPNLEKTLERELKKKSGGQ